VRKPTVEATTKELSLVSSNLPRESETAGLVRRARAGDEAAFALLVERHERMVLRTGKRLLGRPDLAEDAAQEAFLRLHRHLGRVDESRELGPWLYRVVVNVCRDISRRRRLEQPVDFSAAEPESERDSAAALDDALTRDEQRRMVQAALLTLPLKEREAIVLRDIEGLTTAEVAKILGSSEGTVRSQISTGRLKIKRYLEAKREDAR
jgi:RNA polymerase sigma-70 factor, ECF subfamily